MPCAELNARKFSLQNLRKKYSGFKILRGYEWENKGREGVTIFIVKSEKKRKGTLSRFCQERIKENKCVIIVNPTNQAMVNFLYKNRFVKFIQTEANDFWILTPLTPIL